MSFLNGWWKTKIQPKPESKHTETMVYAMATEHYHKLTRIKTRLNEPEAMSYDERRCLAAEIDEVLEWVEMVPMSLIYPET